MTKKHRIKAKKASRKVSIENTAKGLTSQAGLIPAVKFLEKMNIASIINEYLPRERGDNAVYNLSEGIFLTIVGCISGARSMLNVVNVWADGVLRRIGGWLRIPHPTTLGRLFKEMDSDEVTQMEYVNHRLRKKIWRKAQKTGKLVFRPLQNMWIDVDSTVKTVFGKQGGAEKGYNPHKKGAFSFHPLLAFSPSTKEILQAWFREGSAYTSDGIEEFMKTLLFHLPEKARIIFRGDSGFFRGTLLDMLEEKGNGYLIKVKMKGLKGLLSIKDWSPVKGHPDWEQCEFFYACGNWSKERRFVAVRKEIQQEETPDQLSFVDQVEYDYFCYVVSEDLSPWRTHKKYGQRATSETWIDEAKNQMALAHIKTDSFLANAALFQCTVIAYNTIRWMALLSGDKELKKWEIRTTRTFLIRVAGRLTTGGDQLRLKTPEESLFKDQWENWVELAY